MRSTLVVLLALPSTRALPGSTFSSLQPAWNVTVPRVLDWSCSSRNQKVAYIHIPKTGGESLLYSLRQAKAPACNGGTLLTPNNMCACGKRWYAEGFPPLARRDNSQAVCGTEAGTEIAVMEQTHNAFFQYWDGPVARSPCTFWLSTVRDPEDWFYSAVSQWCSNGGRGTQACSGVTYERLLELGWWASPAMSKAISSSKEIKYSRAHRTPLPACRPTLTSALNRLAGTISCTMTCRRPCSTACPLRQTGGSVPLPTSIAFSPYCHICCLPVQRYWTSTRTRITGQVWRPSRNWCRGPR